MNHSSADLSSFAQRALVAAGIFALLLVVLYFLKHVAYVLLIVFAGVLLSIFLSGLAMFLCHRTPLSRGWSLAVTLVLLLALAVGAGWLAGPGLATQLGQHIERIPEAVDRIRGTLAGSAWVQALLERAPQPTAMLPSGAAVMGGLAAFFSTSMGVLVNVLIVLIIGVYVAAAPGLYIENSLYLFPAGKRERAHEGLQAMGRVLRWWLVGRIASMTIVGVLTFIGLLIIGMPLAFALGLIAGLFSFVPYLGPIAAMIPAVLVGLVEGPALAGYVVLVFLTVQLVESNLITPLIQERAVSIPPALLITAQLLIGILAGLLGILVATPLTVSLIVAIQMLYVEDMLGEQVKVMGSHPGRERVSG